MDLIERWFGVSPDGGSGGLEITLIIVAFVVLAALVIKIPLRRSNPQKRMNMEPADS